MAASLPYLVSNKNVPAVFAAISAAKVPDTFTQSFLGQTLGLKASGDRPLIPLLRALDFIDTSGRPTQAYRELKNPTKAKGAIARAVRHAYSPLFEANEGAHQLNSDQLRGLIAQVAGTDADMTKKIGYTFSALSKLGDFSESVSTDIEDDTKPEVETPTPIRGSTKASETTLGSALRPEFHYNFQIHLPTNASEETYLNIFNALRKVFQ